MKAVIRVPTTQYGYIEITVDDLNVKDVVEVHNEFVAEYEKTKGAVQKLKDDNF